MSIYLYHQTLTARRGRDEGVFWEVKEAKWGRDRVEKKKRDWHDVMSHYRLFDDVLMMACFDDVATVQEVLCIILGRPFKMTEVKMQEDMLPSEWYGAVFDVTALDENGNKYDIEIQREDTGEIVKRAEFYSCLLGRMALNTSEKYITMRETFVIFITEKDIFKHEILVYHVEQQLCRNRRAVRWGLAYNACKRRLHR